MDRGGFLRLEFDKMITIIAGSRDIYYTDVEIQELVNDSGFDITWLLCGGAKGIDSCGLSWAKKNKVGYSIHNADWPKYGNAAGPIRNAEMGNLADALILVWDGQSRGSANMLSIAKDRGLKIHEVISDKERWKKSTSKRRYSTKRSTYQKKTGQSSHA